MQVARRHFLLEVDRMWPYRANAKSEERRSLDAASRDWDLVVPFAALWLASLGRIAWVLLSRRAFGAQDTLAVIALVALPALIARGAAPR